MKLIKNIYKVYAIVVFVFLSNQILGQVSCGNTNNTSCAGSDYVGWASSETGLDLNIKHNANSKNINFFTTNGSGTTTKQMTIDPNGAVGIGTASPNNLMQMHGGSATAHYLQFTNSATGSGNDKGFWIGLNNAVNGGTAELWQRHNASMQFFTNDVQRFIIKAGTGNTSGYIGIGNSFTSPASRLHVHQSTADDVWFQISNSTTGNSAGEGLRIGITNSDQNVNIMQQSNAAMLFYTNNGSSTLERARITNTGRVGIGTTPAATGWLEVQTDNSTNPYYAIYAKNDNSTSTSGTVGGIDVNCTVARTGSNTNNGINVLVGGSSNINHGIYSITDKINADYNTGGYFLAKRGDYNRALVAEATNTGGSGTADQNIGVQSNAYDAASFNKAFEGSASGSSDGNYGIDLAVADADYNYGVNITVSNGATNTANYGAQMAVSGGGATNYGAKITVDAGRTTTYGLYADVNGGGGSATDNLAVYGNTHHNGTNNYGVKGVATDGTNNYGVYGVAAIDPVACTAGSCTQAAGYFAGDLVYTGSSFQTSDQFLKQNINPLENSLSLIAQLQPKTYEFKDQSYPQMHLSTGLQYGVIAEDIELIFPDMVRSFVQPAEYDEQGVQTHPPVNFKGVSYTALIPILIAGIQEQQTRIDSLVNVIGNGSRPAPEQAEGNHYRVNLGSSQEAVLFQNRPNPFAGSTTINYFIPEHAGKAVMSFFDNTGVMIREFVIDEKGQGAVEVNATQLKSDIYTYSLIIDGKVVDTKRMVKVK